MHYYLLNLYILNDVFGCVVCSYNLKVSWM